MEATARSRTDDRDCCDGAGAHPGAFGHWLTMRAAQTAAATAWQHLHGTDPHSSPAQVALHHLAARTRRMRDGAGGCKDLGGVWGGFGW